MSAVLYLGLLLGVTDLEADLDALWCSTSEFSCSDTATEEADAIMDHLASYAFLEGRSGGQTWICGTASGNDCTITSSSHSTEGEVFINGAVRAALDAADHSVDTHSFHAVTPETNVGGTAVRVYRDSTGDMADGFGTRIGFGIEDTANVVNIISQIEARRAGGDTTGDLVFRTASAGSMGDRMWVKSSGNVGIGASPSSSVRLDVAADIASGWAGQFFNDGNNANRKGLSIQCGEDTPTSATSATFIEFFEGDGTLTGSITANSTGTVALNASDARRKKNIQPTTLDASEALSRVGLYSFDWKRGNRHVEIGFVAQDVEAAFPAAASELSDGTKAVAVGNFVPVLVKAHQEQAALIEDLEFYTVLLEERLAAAEAQSASLASRIDSLETRLQALETRPPRGVR